MTTLIVGAGPGLGASLARAFAPDGAIGLIAHDADVAGEIVNELIAGGTKAAAAVADVADGPALRAAIGGLSAELDEPVQTAVYNASAFVEGLPTEVSEAEFAAGLSVGITGALTTLQAVAPAMIEAQAGTVLFTGSGVSLEPWTEAVGLSVQKAGMRNLAMAAAAELTPHNVQACTITIRGNLAREGAFGVATIATVFHHVANRPKTDWTGEVQYTGD